jgi:glycosyltransferase involved in cell wall biosynthesis
MGKNKTNKKLWKKGENSVAVVMISLNEAHNMQRILENLSGWANEVFLVDSYSKDHTIDIALEFGVHVVQREFKGFGDQWNFALKNLPIQSKWTMKLDPDEELTDKLKKQISLKTSSNQTDNLIISRKLWFMGAPIPISQDILRVWPTGMCEFSNVIVNEYPLVNGKSIKVNGDLIHHDSPSLEHWFEKQNKYSTDEALIKFKDLPLSDEPNIFGSKLQRRMWLKKNFSYLPFRFVFLFLYYWIIRGAIRSGKVGFIWSRLRADIMRIREYKVFEMKLNGSPNSKRIYGFGEADERVEQFK